MTDTLLEEIHPRRNLVGRVHETHGITADTALRLGLFFSMEPSYRLNLQADNDIRLATCQTQDKIAPRIQVFQLKAV